ncbi:hypothetical protein FOZ62_017379, partial [Perkinsus olseni]
QKGSAKKKTVQSSARIPKRDVALEDTCYSTWKASAESDESVAVGAGRASASERYHMDSVSFHQRLRDTVPLGQLPGHFRKLLPGDDKVAGSTVVRSIDKYYVNLEYFMPTELEGGRGSCGQQLKKRIRESTGEYTLAFKTARKISSNSIRKEYWSFDRADVTRGLEMVWSPKTRNFMIASLTVISPHNTTIPAGCPVDQSVLKRMNAQESAYPSEEPPEDLIFGPYGDLIAYSEAAEEFLSSDDNDYSTYQDMILDALLKEAPSK